MKKIKPKQKVVKSPFTIRTTKDTKAKFQKKAKSLGYKQNEYFELIVKGL